MEHKIKIPEGYQVVVSRVGDMAVIEIAKEEPEFKENDIVYTEYVNHPCISIINSASYNFCSIKTKCSFDVDSNTLYCDSIYSYETIRLATDSEKQLLFDKLEEKCLMFNGKKIVRWRAENGCKYFFVNADGIVIPTTDENSPSDSLRYNNGNYFHTSDIALSYQMKSLEFLTEFHKNL